MEGSHSNRREFSIGLKVSCAEGIGVLERFISRTKRWRVRIQDVVVKHAADELQICLTPEVSLWGASKILQCKLPNDIGMNLTLIGRSWAADTTAFVIPELDIGFDAGYKVTSKKLRHYFISHCHPDHMRMIPFITSRTKPPVLYMPSECVQNADKYIKSSLQLSSDVTDEEFENFSWTRSHSLRGVEPGCRIEVDKKLNLVADVLAMDHSVPCLGYRISKSKKKLKEEYKGLSGKEIGQLRKNGVEISETKYNHILTFMGDTGCSVLDNPEIFNTKILIIECSFLFAEDKHLADSKKHIVWTDLEPHVKANSEVLFILIHFSHRYKEMDVFNFFQQVSLPNVLAWIPPITAMNIEEVWGHSK